MTTENEERRIGGRIVYPSDREELVSDVADELADVETDLVRIRVEPVPEERWQAHQELARCVAETDECLNCGAPVDEDGFCGFDCLQQWRAESGGSDNE